MKVFAVILLSLLLANGCADEESETGDLIVDSSIEAHGGWENFQQLDSVRFLKTTRLYREDGSLESKSVQEQYFRLNPPYEVQILWTEDSVQRQISYDRFILINKYDGEISLDSLQGVEALRLASSAEYVFFQPFKLLDSGTYLERLPDQTWPDSSKVKVVKVSYSDDGEDADKWRHYFDEDYRLIANSVEHQGRYSLIVNLEFQKYNGLLFNRRRQSYFTDSLLNRKYLRADYLYEIIK